jgi:guanylate kinase
VNARLFVIAAPSGAGKTTLVKALVERNPELRFSVSYTTRAKRVNETEGEDYYFVSEDEFIRLRDRGELLESALVFDNYYGTGRREVETLLGEGHHVILEIDWQGARQVREARPDAVSVFILPPSRAELEKRLRTRRTDSEEVIARRLRDALGDMSHWKEFDYALINDHRERAVEALEDIIASRGEEHRVGNPALERRVRAIVAASR